MPTELQELFRNAISEGSDTGMLIAADAMQESEDRSNNTLAELLRMYIDLQTLVRMSQTPSLSFSKRYAELQGEFKTASRRAVAEHYGAEFTKPLGPYYTALSAQQSSLANNPDWLSTEPVRELTVTTVLPQSKELPIILRNYRMQSMFRLEIHISYGSSASSPASFAALCEAIKQIKAPLLQQLVIRNIDNPNNKLLLFFNMASGLPKGCTLWLGNNYQAPTIIGTKKR